MNLIQKTAKQIGLLAIRDENYGKLVAYKQKAPRANEELSEADSKRCPKLNTTIK